MSDGQRVALEALARSQVAPHRQVQRAKALMLAAEGMANSHIAEDLELSPPTVRTWRERFGSEGLAKLGEVRAGRGRKPSISDDKVAEIVNLTLHSKPDGHTHWSCRTMAAHVGVSPATVQRIWDARGLKPHRVDNFKLSNDPKFEDKLHRGLPARHQRPAPNRWSGPPPLIPPREGPTWTGHAPASSQPILRHTTVAGPQRRRGPVPRRVPQPPGTALRLLAAARCRMAYH